MDYTNDDGLLMFTPNEAAEMQGVLNTVRLSIQYSTGSGNCKDSIDTITSLLSISPELNLSVYPNPSTGLITLSYILPEKGEATILNTLGQSLFNRELTEVGQNARAGFDLSAYSGWPVLHKSTDTAFSKNLKIYFTPLNFLLFNISKSGCNNVYCSQRIIYYEKANFRYSHRLYVRLV